MNASSTLITPVSPTPLPLVVNPTSAPSPAPLDLDAREQLFNEGAVGPIDQIQVSTERIAKLRGILFDLDPANLRSGPLVPMPSLDPESFYEHCLKRWLAHHPVLEHLEVRASGTGLHGILWLEPQPVFDDATERTRWCAIVKIVQAALPTDPCAPGITATTRALGSVNGKNNEIVRQLQPGRPVAPDRVIALKDELCQAPFKTLFRILTGADRLAPCPFCHQETLVALEQVGRCYGCGRSTLERLSNELFQPHKEQS